jgi:hypothetical protein
MRTLAENFLSPSFGAMGAVVPIVITKNPISFQVRVRGPDYTSAVGANGNLP